MRQIVLDTETTGLEVSQGHRIIEIGCVELVNRRLTGNHYHQYINPEREVEQGAIEVHGITNEFLADKPVFSQIAAEFVDYIAGAELIIHNAPFDIGFLNAELQRLDAGYEDVDKTCSIIDTLVMARSKHPGQRNSLDALCARYMVDNSQRELHGALLDSEILADVYLLLTGGQTALSLSDHDSSNSSGTSLGERLRRLPADRMPLPITEPSADELAAEQALFETMAAGNGGTVLWREMFGSK
ncbi:DNA polymerase III subunit epsilon [Parahaliea sp. F7430]|uniref:DNA polymerase III subunit epsilon n=1 Tax=Sediminihaliea albiluteola TaxID=2758564 RepID=A0A7W2TUM0_9GAMM|nr:DNA polymerase III subunit epsilon [Sediminihaliea albiluteola]MBA6412214.1 DNA polymerase III subunit epsilon [Sediminihaliea albiluteola]